jgi:hypothetical protein
MFWGWFSSGGGMRRSGGGCLFLPFLFLCGMVYMFDGFNTGWLMPLLMVGLIWLVFSMMFNSRRQAQTESNGWDYEKPKRGLSDYDEKPKRGTKRYLGDDGEIIEMDDSNEVDYRTRDDEL